MATRNQNKEARKLRDNLAKRKEQQEKLARLKQKKAKGVENRNPIPGKPDNKGENN